LQEPVFNRVKIDEILKKDWFWLALIIVTSVLFQLYRIGDAFGGFHGFNESFYASYAKSFLNKPVINLLKSSTDFNNPPLFSFFLYLSYRLFGVSEISSRIVPITFSAISIFFTYKIALILYDKKTALLGAAFWAFCPVFIIVGRNVQTESTFIAFMLASLYFYIKSGKKDEWENRIMAGVLLGLGLFAKLPSILIIGPIVLWEFIKEKNLKWIKPSFISFVVLPFAIFLPWITYHLIFNPTLIAGQQMERWGSFRVPNTFFLYHGLLTELFYALSPLIFLIFCCGLMVFILRRGESDYLLLLLIGVYFLFYLFFHQHSYYFLPALPFASIVAANYISLIKKQSVFVSVVVFSIVTTLFASLLLMASCKYGFDGLKNIANFINNSESSEKIVVGTSEVLSGSYGPILTYYSPKIELKTVKDEVAAKKNGAKYFVDLGGGAGRQHKDETIVFNESRYLLVFFNRTIYFDPISIHCFGQGQYVVERTTVSGFGLKEIKVPNLILTKF